MARPLREEHFSFFAASPIFCLLTQLETKKKNYCEKKNIASTFIFINFMQNLGSTLKKKKKMQNLGSTLKKKLSQLEIRKNNSKGTLQVHLYLLILCRIQGARQKKKRKKEHIPNGRRH